MSDGTLGSQIAHLALLDEPARRALYLHVARQRSAVSRDQAAAAVGISRALAAFHLDKLVEGGLLETEFRRLSGRTGPGAGRPAKLYRRSARQLAVSLPPRSYGLAAGMFAEALERSGPKPRQALARVAGALGLALGEETARRAGPRPGRDRLLEATTAGLESLGFEPERGPGGDICLRNCPFHALTERHRDLVCAMNLALMEGFVSGVGEGARGLRAVLDPQPGMCCVVLRRRPGRPAARPARRARPR